MHRELSRRDFNRLTVAALGGVVAGASALARADDEPKDEKEEKEGEKKEGEEEKEIHVCRGLNTCNNKGASGENDCAGQGTCSTAVEHTCGGQNDCKNQ